MWTSIIQEILKMLVLPFSAYIFNTVFIISYLWVHCIVISSRTKNVGSSVTHNSLLLIFQQNQTTCKYRTHHFQISKSRNWLKLLICWSTSYPTSKVITFFPEPEVVNRNKEMRHLFLLQKQNSQEVLKKLKLSSEPLTLFENLY